MTLKPLTLRLGLEDDGSGEREHILARVSAAEAALERLEALKHEDWVYPDTIERVRAMFDYRRRRFTARMETEGKRTRRARGLISGFCARSLPRSASACSSCATNGGSAMRFGAPSSPISTTRSHGSRSDGGSPGRHSSWRSSARTGFVSIKGSARARAPSKRSGAATSLLIRAAAAELPTVNLEDALQICVIVADQEPARFERASFPSTRSGPGMAPPVRIQARLCSPGQLTAPHA